MSIMNNIPTKRTPSKWQIDHVLQEAVDKYIKEDPARYRLAQRYGEFIVDHQQFSNMDNFKVEQRDITGDEIRYNEIYKMMRYYGVKPKELESYELEILKNKLGLAWVEILIKEFNFNKDDFPN